MYDIEHCRGPEFGSHWQVCDSCGHLEKGYNSCRNRHCPGCNTISQKKWVKLKNDDTFLFPVKALSRVFRAKFLEGIKRVYDKGLLKLPYDLSFLEGRTTFRQWLFHEVPKEWVVFSKPPFAGPEEVIKYIGRYTHRCAISNNRIIAQEDGKVEFWFKNTRKNARWETTSLPAETFIERFLYHVLPKHFHRIRYYGFLANGKAGANINNIRQDIENTPVETPEVQDRCIACPKCQKGTMATLLIIDGYGNIITDNQSDETDQLVKIPINST